jgi:hypothetical protein
MNKRMAKVFACFKNQVLVSERTLHLHLPRDLQDRSVQGHGLQSEYAFRQLIEECPTDCCPMLFELTVQIPRIDRP